VNHFTALACSALGTMATATAAWALSNPPHVACHNNLNNIVVESAPNLRSTLTLAKFYDNGNFQYVHEQKNITVQKQDLIRVSYRQFGYIESVFLLRVDYQRDGVVSALDAGYVEEKCLAGLIDRLGAKISFVSSP
jgi:hypothetical protein